MKLEQVEKIARAVLYEGYMLYPYRPSSVKNRQRWNFGVLYPRAYTEAQGAGDAWSMQTECLAEAEPEAALEVRVKFLQPVVRLVREVHESRASGEGDAQSWQEAVERELCVLPCRLASLAAQPMLQPFALQAEDQIESGGAEGAEAIVRRRDAVQGEIELCAERAGDTLFKLSVRIRNTTVLAGEASRDEALLRSLVSAHTILGLQDGSFLSAIDPPEELRTLAASCKNVGTWPVLVGTEGERDTMLSSPIILYDYPQIAPESAGDLFDGTEIDEILSLRIMTLTDEEKREMRDSDERARQILERTDALPAEQWAKLHGALRGLRPTKEDAA
jgi:hydrogenase maturation protease